jgi:hypothetical protein
VRLCLLGSTLQKNRGEKIFCDVFLFKNFGVDTVSEIIDHFIIFGHVAIEKNLINFTKTPDRRFLVPSIVDGDGPIVRASETRRNLRIRNFGVTHFP